MHKNDYDYTYEQLLNIKNKKDFVRFQGEICWKCGVKANIPIYKSTNFWTCVCGEKQKINKYHILLPFMRPNLGPGKHKIEYSNVDDYMDEEERDWYYGKSW